MQQLQAFYRQYCPPASIPPVYKPFSAFYFSYHIKYNTTYCFLQQQVSIKRKHFSRILQIAKTIFHGMPPSVQIAVFVSCGQMSSQRRKR
jgi:hypothetical protein